MVKLIRKETELEQARALLCKMEADPTIITESAYRANKEVWPNNQITFVDAHLSYLRTYPQVSVQDYISNLRLKLKKTSQRSSS